MIILFENIFLIYFISSLYLISKKLALFFFKNDKNENYILSYILTIIVSTYVIFLAIILRLYNNYIIYLLSTICLLFPLFYLYEIKKFDFEKLVKDRIFLLFIPYFM